MRKIFLLMCILFVMVLTGCQEDVCVEKPVIYLYPEQETEVEVQLDEDGKTWERVENSKNLRRISLAIPTGWEYAISESADNSSEEFGISFWPEGQEQGQICVWYHSAWGVCGTGLEEVKITLGDYSALQGTYDNKDVWDYICFNVADTKGYYVALNEGAEAWWDEYGTDAMKILATIKITEGASVEYLD